MWYYLGHTQYRFIELIQVSDLVGAYGVSFIVATSAAALAGILPESLLGRDRYRSPSGSALVEGQPLSINRRNVVAVGVLPESCRGRPGLWVGPPVAGRVYHGAPHGAHSGELHERGETRSDEALSIFNKHYLMTGAAVKYQPDVIVWPETMYRNPLLLKSPDVSDKRFAATLPGDSRLGCGNRHRCPTRSAI